MLTFWGIELDTVAQVSHLSVNKIANLVQHFLSFREVRKIPLRDLQQCVGHLNFACKVAAPWWAFLHGLCEAMAGLRPPHHRIRVSASMRADFEVWLQFLQTFNGASFWHTDLLLEAKLCIKSDAAESLGFGVYFCGHWCVEAWPPVWSEAGVCRNLIFLELFPILVVVWLWGDQLANHSVHFWCDNLAMVQVLNSLISKSHRVMELVRTLTLRCLKFNVLFLARHLLGVDNGVADANRWRDSVSSLWMLTGHQPGYHRTCGTVEGWGIQGHRCSHCS